jgi:GNAT superfamily N-acetyltransferase
LTTIRALLPGDDRSRFRSGDPDLDRFFAKYAGQNQFRHHIGTTYVALADDETTIVGFATVSAASIELDSIPAQARKNLPDYPLPVLRLARLAVHERARGLGLGKRLLRYVFQLARELANTYGCVGIVVDAKPAAMKFYEGFGFEPIEVLEGESPARPKPTALFLALRVIEAAAASR